MQGILLLNILSIQSSYKENFEETIEQPDAVPDTLQWWISEAGVWRIRTYAIDHDIHPYSVGGEWRKVLPVAKANNLKHYGDVTAAEYEISLLDCTDPALIANAFRVVDLVPRLEVSADRFVFWKPDEAEYMTQSEPKS
jgi:hypothetical protein